MDFNSSSDLPVELSEAELAAVHGGGRFKWLAKSSDDARSATGARPCTAESLRRQPCTSLREGTRRPVP